MSLLGSPSVRFAAKVARRLLLVAVVVASVVVTLRLAGPSGTPAPRPGDAPPVEFQVPLFSENWTDDSGNGLAQKYNLGVEDPRSLAEVGAAKRGRAARGIAQLRRELAAVSLEYPAGRARALHTSVFIGLLHMSAGEFAEADDWFAKAQAIAPECPRLLLANIEALRGVAALRRGEADNCVSCCTESSCIFPLDRASVHRLPSGSRDAIRHFARYLEQRPEDLGVRWLLNVAHMTLGTYPRDVPEPFLIPLGSFRSEGSVGRFANVAEGVGLGARGEDMAGGIVVDDLNGDGLPDAFYSTLDPARGCTLFLNSGDGSFEDHSRDAGLGDQVGALNCNQADYDNDGDLDILLLRGGFETPSRPSLLRNDGKAHFTDVTIAAGVGRPIASQAAGWSDYDGDGDLDLYIGGEYDPKSPDPRNQGKLYRNNGDGTFADVAERAGVLNLRVSKGVAWGDYDDDGKPDLYLSNWGQANRLYRNNGDGTFADVAESLGVTEPIGSFSCWFWDYDNDGRLDIFVAGTTATLPQVIRSHLGQPTGGERPRLYHNEGGRFANVTIEAGLDRVWLPMGSNFGDIDNDGFLDFYLGTGSPQYSYIMPDVLMHNRGGRRFEDVTLSSGTGHLQKGHGISFADWDRDGDVDLFLKAGGATPGDKAHSALFRNPGHGNRWLALKLIGRESNRGALGARVRVDVSGPGGARSIHRVIGSGSSFGNNPLSPTIGLGKAESITSLEVRWPGSGTLQIIGDVPLDRSVVITEGEGGYGLADVRPSSAPDPGRGEAGR